MTDSALPSRLDPFITMIRAKLERASAGNAYDVAFPALFVTKLAAVLEDARDALAGQNEPAKFGEGPVVPRVLLPADDVIRETLLVDKYTGLVTDLEKLVFWTTHANPEQGKAFRAFLEGRPAVPVVTP